MNSLSREELLTTVRLLLLLGWLVFLVGCSAVRTQIDDGYSDVEQEELRFLLSKRLVDPQHAAGDHHLPDEAYQRLHEVSGNVHISPGASFRDELTKYLQDNSYHCTRPLHDKYFASRFGRVIHTPNQCPQQLPFAVATGIEGESILWLDPDRVISIHVLFAGQGDGIVSRFGHLSFRLIVCPETDKTEKACNRNLQEHLVLGYRAHVDDFNIDYFSGVFGGYRAHLYANRFMDVYQEYAIGEFREVYSLPLKLSDRQVARMVREMSAIHWGYSGDYRFLTNNCSSIAQKYLVESWEDFAANDELSGIFWRPDHFFRQLTESPLAEHDVLDDLGTAEREGHYFPSTRPIYERAFSMVQAELNHAEFGALDDYPKLHPKKRLANASQTKGYHEALIASPRLLDAQLLLEELSVVRDEKRLMAELSGFFSRHPPAAISQQLTHKVDPSQFEAFQMCILNPVMAYFQPRRIEKGIPEAPVSGEFSRSRDYCSSTATREHIDVALRELKQQHANDWAPVDTAIDYWQASLETLMFYSNMESQL